MLNVLNISGAAVVVIGVMLAVLGIRQCRSRISEEENFIPAEAEIIEMQSRLSIVTINCIPLIAKEYRPLLRYETVQGREIFSSAMPYALKMSDEYKELFQMYESHTAITIKYNPKKPEEFYYRSKKGFRLREVVYKMFVAALLVFIGSLLIWSGFNM